MTILVSGGVATVATVGAVSGALAGLTTGLVLGLGSPMMGTGAAGAIGAVGASASAGAIFGSVLGGEVTSALAGGAAGAASSAIVSAIPAVLSGPVGSLILGATQPQPPQRYSLDCWKNVLHEDSAVPSNGRLLKNVVMDPRIKQVLSTINSTDSSFPQIILQNIWDETFRIDYVFLPNNQMAAHAVFLE